MERELIGITLGAWAMAAVGFLFVLLGQPAAINMAVGAGIVALLLTILCFVVFW